MDNYAPTPTSFEANEIQLPAHTEPEHSDIEQVTCNDSNRSSDSKKGFPLHYLIIVMLAIMLIINAIQSYQYKEYAEVIEKEAYVISVSINLLEDTLMFKHGILPEDIGLEELRSAWISDPCYETAISYYTALKDALEYFENTSIPLGNYKPIEV